MATNLWRDVDALLRLSRSARDLERHATPGDDFDGAAAALLPQSDRGDYQIAARELPARVVSGDLADAFELPTGEVALVLADVSGKGAPAGVLRAFTRSILRHVAHCSTSPGETFARVNGILYDARLDAMFVSLFMGWLDPATGVLRYASAGHPSPLRCAVGSPPKPFASATGPILGILGLESFASDTEQLRRGETMLLYTDGVSEARSTSGRFLGTRPLVSLLAQHVDGSLDYLCDEVVRTIDDFQGHRRHDDATLLAMRWLGPTPQA